MFSKKEVALSTHYIEYYDNDIRNKKPVIIFSPGIWEPGWRYTGVLDMIHDHRILSISYRGRGNSTNPIAGFDSFDHADDLNAMLKAENIEPNEAIFLSFSKGVSYSLAYLEKYSIKPSKLILIDYPPIHISVAKGYADYWRDMVYGEYHIKDYVTEETLKGIEKESTFYDFSSYLKNNNIDTHLFISKDTSASIPTNLDDECMEMFELIGNVSYHDFNNSGHMILDDEPERFLKLLRGIIE